MNFNSIDNRILSLRRAVAKTNLQTAEALMDLGAIDKTSVPTRADNSQQVDWQHIEGWHDNWTQFNQWVNE